VLLLVPILRIVVAGLFVVTFVPTQETLHLMSTSTFNSILNTSVPPTDIPSDGFASQIFALTQSNTIPQPLPDWVTTEAAVGGVDFSKLNVLGLHNVTTVIPLPVIQGGLTNCTIFAESDLKKGVVFKDGNLGLIVQPKLAHVHTRGNATTCDVEGYEFVIDQENPFLLSPPEQPGWLARFYSIACGGNLIIFGRTDATNTSIIQDLTAIQCFEEMTLCVSLFCPLCSSI
jgi:hypothetical protein